MSNEESLVRIEALLQSIRHLPVKHLALKQAYHMHTFNYVKVYKTLNFENFVNTPSPILLDPSTTALSFSKKKCHRINCISVLQLLSFTSSEWVMIPNHYTVTEHYPDRYACDHWSPTMHGRFVAKHLWLNDKQIEQKRKHPKTHKHLRKQTLKTKR